MLLEQGDGNGMGKEAGSGKQSWEYRLKQAAKGEDGGGDRGYAQLLGVRDDLLSDSRAIRPSDFVYMKNSPICHRH